MSEMGSQTGNCVGNCLSCVHFGYCLVYWGTECKRQGGTKIPRMKSKRVEARSKVDRNKSRKSDRSNSTDPRNKVIQMVEPIRTKVANW